MDQRDIVGHERIQVDGTADHDHFVDLRGSSGIDDVGDDRTSVDLGEEFVGVACVTGPGAGGRITAATER